MPAIRLPTCFCRQNPCGGDYLKFRILHSDREIPVPIGPPQFFGEARQDKGVICAGKVGIVGKGCSNERARSSVNSLPIDHGGPGPSTSRSSPLTVVNQRSSPGFAGFGWFLSSQGAQYFTTHKPSAVVGGLLVTSTRQRWSGSVERFQPMMKRY